MVRKTFRKAMTIVGEKQSIFLLISLGIWIALPWKSFEGQSWVLINSNLSEEFVGSFFLLLAIIHLFGYIYHLSKDHKTREIGQKMRGISLFIETLLWTCLSVSTFVSYPPSLYGIMYVWFIVGSYSSFTGYRKIDESIG